MELALAVMVIAVAFLMLREKNRESPGRVSVVIQNSDSARWTAFKYGLKMAAEDCDVELLVVNTEGALSASEEMKLIEREIDGGADAVIVQPVPGDDTEEMLKRIEQKVPVILIEGMGSAFPVVEPDHYDMGHSLGEELLKDYGGHLSGKTIGIVSESAVSKPVINRERGFLDALDGEGATLGWSASGSFGEEGEHSLEMFPGADIVIALDDSSLAAAGKCSAANNLHGAVVYGIGNSTEAVYYLDTGIAKCLIVPDDFNVGYQSLAEAAKKLGHPFRRIESRTVSYSVIRRDELFSKENQDILFTMSH